jgi:hypothetical protein
MPGLEPGIHVLVSIKQESRGWPDMGERKRRRSSKRLCPAMTSTPFQRLDKHFIAPRNDCSPNREDNPEGDHELAAYDLRQAANRALRHASDRQLRDIG